MSNSEKSGIWSAMLCYVIWGLLPLYWKTLTNVPSQLILAERIVWSFVFMLLVLVIGKRMKLFKAEWLNLLKRPKKLLILFITSAFITVNWGIYIWAVNSNHIVEASLGYYINPLVSVVFALIFLKEKLNRLQIIAVTLAVVGVLLLTFQYGKFPWIAVLLAVSFAVYGLLKKLTPIEAQVGLTLEMMMIAPLALVFLLVAPNSLSEIGSYDSKTMILLICAGPMTALPLLLFSQSAQKIPLTLLGFLQYIAPTLQMGIGVYVYGETITQNQFFAYCFIWAALIVFSFANVLQLKKMSNKVERTVSSR